MQNFDLSFWIRFHIWLRFGIITKPILTVFLSGDELCTWSIKFSAQKFRYLFLTIFKNVRKIELLVFVFFYTVLTNEVICWNKSIIISIFSPADDYGQFFEHAQPYPKLYEYLLILALLCCSYMNYHAMNKFNIRLELLLSCLCEERKCEL